MGKKRGGGKTRNGRKVGRRGTGDQQPQVRRGKEKKKPERGNGGSVPKKRNEKQKKKLREMREKEEGGGVQRGEGIANTKTDPEVPSCEGGGKKEKMCREWARTGTLEEEREKKSARQLQKGKKKRREKKSQGGEKIRKGDKLWRSGCHCRGEE